MVSTVSRVSGEYCRLYWGRRGWGGVGEVLLIVVVMNEHEVLRARNMNSLKILENE